MPPELTINNQPPADPGNNPPAQPTETPPTYDEWLAQQPAEIKTVIEGNISGLRSALQSERQQREDLAKQLRDAAKGSQGATKEALERLTSDLDAANARADFFADATKAEIGCSNPQLAWLAARESDLIDKKGRVNWEQLKTHYPELFRRPAPPAGNAGAGTSSPPTAGKSMNAYIRAAAGRG